jgi:anthranilate phosphoribosyltransferase
MDIQSAIRAVTEHRNLTGEEMTSVMRTIMGGEATQAQIGGFLIGLRMKGETVEEIAAAAGVMRELATRVQVAAEHLVDTCGTGGDGSSTFNISTASAFVVAGAGATVAKHGNRAASSSSGSADVLEAAGVNLDLTPDQVATCIREARVGFMFAPMHHGAMKHAIGPRREMAVRTIFNVLGPLTNPAGAPNQVVGVFTSDLIEPLARVLAQLGSRHVLVVHADDGLDEISIGADTHVAEAVDGSVRTFTIGPEQFGMKKTDLGALTVSSPEESLEVLRSVFDNADGPARDIVALNAGAAIYASGLAGDLNDGVAAAQESLASGAARGRLAKLVALSNSF